MPTTINEGRLKFTFPNHWHVVKYDETKFYREKIIPIAAKLKAVDFVAVPHPGLNTLLMIEVKDFRGYAVENRKRITSDELIVEIVEKVMHTLSALNLVNYSSNAELVNFATNLLSPPSQINLILFVEQDAVAVQGADDTKGKLTKSQNNNIQNMQTKLNQKLKRTVKINCQVLNTELLKARDGFTVDHI